MGLGLSGGRGRTVRAAGGVVCRGSEGGGLEVLVVHRNRYDDWSFPKGKLEPGESELECAIREIQEETGLLCEPIRELRGTGYLDRDGSNKTVRYWLMKEVSGRFRPNSEVDQVRWMHRAQAKDLLSYEHDRSLLDDLTDPEQASVLLIRHGTAGNRRAWEGDDRLRPLDPRGVLQAGELAHRLAGYPIRRIFTSPYLRCSQTVAPLADRLGLAVAEVNELAEGASKDEVLGLLRGLQGSVIVLCTHGDVMDQLVGSKAPCKKGSVWVLSNSAGGLKTVRYLPPPKV